MRPLSAIAAAVAAHAAAMSAGSATHPPRAGFNARVRRLLLLTLLLAAVPAAPAAAATVAVDGTTLRFSAEGGEANYPTFHYRAEDELVVYDSQFPGQPVTAGPGCAQDGDNTVVCPRGAITRAEFALAVSRGA